MEIQKYLQMVYQEVNAIKLSRAYSRINIHGVGLLIAREFHLTDVLPVSAQSLGSFHFMHFELCFFLKNEYSAQDVCVVKMLELPQDKS